MFHLRKLIAAAALATVALFAAPGQQAQAATLAGSQTAVIGLDYTFNTTVPTPTSVPIGPVTYSFDFLPATTGNAVLTASFAFVQFSGALSGAFLQWSDGVTTITENLVSGTGILSRAVPLALGGPKQTLTIGFNNPTGETLVLGVVDVTPGAVSAIPLPASGLLLLAGLGAVVLLRRRVATRAA
jgi:hypothetical protein